MNNSDVLILSSSHYDFKDSETGKQIIGSTVWLIPLSSNDEYTNGLKPVKYSLRGDQMNLLNDFTLPAYATMIFEFDFARNRIIPSSFEYLAPFKVGSSIDE